MDTPLHALAVPDADRSKLKRPEACAAAIISGIASLLPNCSIRMVGAQT
jgi:hypothetical protein